MSLWAYAPGVHMLTEYMTFLLRRPSQHLSSIFLMSGSFCFSSSLPPLSFPLFYQCDGCLSSLKCAWYQKRKLGVPLHFSEIIKLQFGLKCHTLLCILLPFRIIVSCLFIIISEKCVVTPNFLFWIPIALAKICYSCIVINRAKILLY